MTFNSIPMIQQKVKTDFEMLLSTVTGDDGQNCSADQMERHLFEQLLRLGANLMQLFFDMRSQTYPRKEAVNEAGKTLPYHSEKSRDYFSIFGELSITRPYFYRKNEGGYSPLDAELGLGKDGYSDFLRELHDELSVYIPFAKEVKMVNRFLGIRLSTRCTQQFVETDAADVEAYYKQKPPPPVEEEASVLALQAAGKGVPIIIKASANKDKVRLKRGEARSRKKAVTATAIYTIQPAPRSVDDVMASLLKEGETKTDLNRSRPQHKQIWGTLQGKDAALDRLQGEVEKRMGDHSQHWVMLCDGDKSLQNHLATRFADFTLILDFIHAYEYFWQVANALYGEDDPNRQLWILKQTRRLLNGQAYSLAITFRQMSQERGRSASQQKILRKVATSFTRLRWQKRVNTDKAKNISVFPNLCLQRCPSLSFSSNIDNFLSMLARKRLYRFRKQRHQQRLYKRDWPEEVSLPTLSRPSKRSTKIQSVGGNAHTSITKQSYAQLPLAG